MPRIRRKGADKPAQVEISGAEAVIALDLKDKVELLTRLVAGLEVLNLALPERASGRQLQTLLTIARAQAKLDKERPRVTLADIIKESNGSIGAHMNRSVKMLTDPAPDGVGWVTTISDPADGRKKYLTLTPEGHRVVAEFLEKVA